MKNAVSDDERFARLRLSRSRGIGPMTYAELMRRAGSAVEAALLLPDLISGSGRRGIELASVTAIEREWAEARRLGLAFVTLGEPDYPGQLAAIADPPPVLGLLGKREYLTRIIIAIVGARNASAAALAFTRDLARDLGEEDVVVVSGLARGIDGAAHQGSLRTGTIAVLAGGADSIYPPQHRDLYQAVLREGLIISEQPIGMVARAQDFPKRNRIVSGLSRGVIVVEAAERSGTLITARLANEQGRDVFAVPGSPIDPRSRGTNELIRKGAILVQDASDVLSELSSGQGRLFEHGATPLTEEDDDTSPALREQLLSLLSYQPVHRDALITETGASPQQAAMVLLDLILEGVACEDAGGRYSLAVAGGGR